MNVATGGKVFAAERRLLGRTPCRRSSDHFVCPGDSEDFHVAIGEIIPEDSREAACDVAVKFAACFSGGAGVDVSRGKVPDGLEAREEELAIALAQLAGKIPERANR